MKCTCIGVGATALSKLRREVADSSAGRKFQVAAHYVGGDNFDENSWEDVFSDIPDSDLLILDLMGVPVDFAKALDERLEQFEGDIVVVNTSVEKVRKRTRLGRFSTAGMSSSKDKNPDADTMDKMRKMIGAMEKIGKTLPIGILRDMRNYLWIVKYWRYSSDFNIRQLVCMIGREYFGIGGLPRPLAPEIPENAVIMSPLGRKQYQTYEEWAEAWSFHDEHPRVLLLYSSSPYPVDTHPPTEELIERFYHAGIDVVPVACSRLTGKDLEFVREIAFDPGIGAARFDVCVNFIAFRIGQGPMGGNAGAAVDFLQQLDIPVFHPFFITKRTAEQWRGDRRGVRSGEFMLHYFLPELDGAVEIYPVGMLEEDGRTGALALVDERAEKLIGRVLAWTNLRRISNREKKIALILYNYPPGESNLGGGAFLDSFASAEKVINRLVREGYTAERTTKEELLSAFLEGRRVNLSVWGTQDRSAGAIEMDGKRYRLLTRNLPDPEGVEKKWGPFPGRIMQREGKAVTFPVLQNGNICIAFQPPRSERNADPSEYHDPHLPPHHQYIGFYRWLEHEFGAHAVLHFGTHGTLEFLPGKELAMSACCYPDYLIGCLPHFYVYYSGSPAESMIAKRRSHAVMISHMEPGYKRVELNEAAAECDALLSEYDETARTDPDRTAEVERELREKTESLGWPWEGADALMSRLYEYKESFVPHGLHVLGEPLEDEERKNCIYELLRYGRDRLPSLPKTVARVLGLPYQTMETEPEKHQREWDSLKRTCMRWIDETISGSDDPAEALQEVCSGRETLHAREAERESLSRIAEEGRRYYRLLTENREIDSIVRGFEGRFLPAGPAGDILRNSDILPTGRNMYQFDPRRVPTPSADIRGRTIARNTLSRYWKERGGYPKKVALVFWGLETAKTHGESVAQVLEYIGVRVHPVNNYWEYELEVIPQNELGHPRIDVSLQMSGFFRDLFPHCMEMLNNAFTLVADLDEDEGDNYFKQVSEDLYRELLSRGMEAEEAMELSRARLFGPDRSAYGTGLTGVVNASAWKEEKDLVEGFMNSLRFVYSRRHQGLEMKELLESNLRQVELVSQIRASRDYEMTDLDHFYEFFGGLSKSVEQSAGAKPVMLVSDSCGGKERTETVRRAIERGVWTRLLNPSWIDGLIKSGHAGVQDISKRFENLLGLSATTGAVDNAVYNAACDTLILDEAVREKMREKNPYALGDIIQRLFETEARGYWQADEERLEKLREIYLELENSIEKIDS